MTQKSYVITAGEIREQMQESLNRMIAERNVIKVPGVQQPPVNIPQEPAAPAPAESLPQPDANAAIDDAVNQPQFDAGVEADPDTDHKKYLQQLTGKLSTELQKFVNENPNEAKEICKYILGMIVKQASKPLDDADKKEIIKKINSVEAGDESGEQAEPGAQQQEINLPPVGESVIKETLLDTNQPEPKSERQDQKQRTAPTAKNRPYKPKF